jgi:hypothetical protein
VRLYPLLVLAGIVSLFFLTGRVSISGPSADQATTLQDVAMLSAAVKDGDSVPASEGIYALLERAQRMGGPRGARLIREQLPSLDARFEADAPQLRQRLAALELSTAWGRRCRVAFLRAHEQERWFLYTLANDVSHSRSTWPVVRRYRARWHRWVKAHGTFVCTFKY